jgi:hypothetical protein
MMPIVTSAEVLLGAGCQLAVVVAAFVWVKADVSQTKKDISTIKKSLGLENGNDPAFVRASNCVLMEREVDRRLSEVQREVKEAAQKADHAVEVAKAESTGIQGRLAAAELTLRALVESRG